MGCGCGAEVTGNCKNKNRRLINNRNRLQTLFKTISDPVLKSEYSQKILEMNSMMGEGSCVDSTVLNYFTNYVRDEYSKHH